MSFTIRYPITSRCSIILVSYWMNLFMSKIVRFCIYWFIQVTNHRKTLIISVLYIWVYVAFLVQYMAYTPLPRHHITVLSMHIDVRTIHNVLTIVKNLKNGNLRIAKTIIPVHKMHHLCSIRIFLVVCTIRICITFVDRNQSNTVLLLVAYGLPPSYINKITNKAHNSTFCFIAEQG